jgi:Cd2+/Zn2+-exporting ATPase
MDPQTQKDHSIAEHDGILDIVPVDSGEKVRIDFDPQKLDEQEIRRIASEHLKPVVEEAGDGIRRWVMRLDGQACEAAAAKLERRVGNVPGVRRATATYIGRVLCLTFDTAVSDEAAVLDGVRGAGAKVRPLEARPTARPGWIERLRSGDLNEELSCGAGLCCMVLAAVLEHTMGKNSLTHWLYGGAYLFGGQYGVRSAIASLREKTLDVDLLMVLAALGAVAVGAPFEGALLLFLFSFSNVLQRHAMDRTQRAIESLLTLRPEEALKKSAAGPERVAIDSLVPGDVVIVRPGELLPVDGTITEGSGSIDEASLTGESMPVQKGIGDPVFAGTLNQAGGLEVRVSKAAEDTTLAKMVRLVAEAQAEKSTTQRFLEKAEQHYAAGVIAFTILVFLIPWLAAGEEFSPAFYRAMTVMVVASPCALIISTPATVLSAIGGAARRGILIKGGSHLETAARADIVCFDKTGTLTHGKPEITDILTSDSEVRLTSDPLAPEATTVLRICAAIEARSEHPLATAVVAATKLRNIPLPHATAFQSITGKGAEADVEGMRYVVGSPRLFEEQHAVGIEPFLARTGRLEADGKTCILLGRRGPGDTLDLIAGFALADTLREEAKSVIARLHQIGVKKVVMLTGDRAGVAAAIARQVGIDEFRAGLLPADKVREIRSLKEEGTVMMIGDGVNDAPALASSHLGVAMGAAGTDIAMETADVVLMGDKLGNIPNLLEMARHARRVLIQNLVFASAVIVVLVAAALGFALPLPIGVIGHEGSTVLVCLNGLRLLGYRPKT